MKLLLNWFDRWADDNLYCIFTWAKHTAHLGRADLLLIYGIVPPDRHLEPRTVMLYLADVLATAEAFQDDPGNLRRIGFIIERDVKLFILPDLHLKLICIFPLLISLYDVQYHSEMHLLHIRDLQTNVPALYGCVCKTSADYSACSLYF